MPGWLRHGARWTLAVCAAAVLGLSLVAGDALGALRASIQNSTDQTTSATMKYTHSYGTPTPTTCATPAAPTDAQTIACTNSLYPASVPSTGNSSLADSITAAGNLPVAGITQTAQAASCGAVALNNDLDTTNPMVARGGTSFGTTGPITNSAAITLNGTTGYQTSVLAQTLPTGPAFIGSASYGMGVWFKANSGTSGPLFGYSASPGNGSGSADRILYLAASGAIGFIPTTSGAGMVSATTGFNNGAWHFAYVRIDTSRLIVGLSYTATIYVDGTQVSTGSSGLLGALTSYSGYWHLGWSTVGGISSYFTGSLSNFVVIDNGSAPTSLTGSTTQAAFDTATAAASERWRLNDTGTTTTTAYTSALPVTNAVCSYVDLQWGFTNPLSCAAAPASATAACTGPIKLSQFVTNGAATVASAALGSTQISTISLSRDSTYTGATTIAFLSGLMVYAPLTITVRFGATQWRTAFGWSSSPGSTFLS